MPKPKPKSNSGGISWIKKSEPKFIRDFKERIAYKDQATTETKKKKQDDDLLIERDEDRPQVIQLKEGDLGEREYLELKSKEDIENSASSFGKILFKKPQKKSTSTSTANEDQPNTSSKKTEIDLIFNLNADGKEEEEETEKQEQGDAAESSKEATKKKLLLNDSETKEEVKYGLQEPPVKKRTIDKLASNQQEASSNLVAKILAREAKAGNKKLLSFYDEEQDELDEFNKELKNEKNQQGDSSESD